MLMHTFATIAAQLFLAMSVSAPTAAAAADFIGSVVATPPSANANRRLQQVECVCSPVIYVFLFRLPYQSDCVIDTIQGNPGVSDSSCLIDPEVEDSTLVEIQELRIIEYDANFTIVRDGLFDVRDMDQLFYQSISAELNPAEPLADQVQRVPRSIQLTVEGNNAEGVTFRSTVGWEYDLTNCDAEPIMEEGDVIGGIDVIKDESAIPAFCPAVETEPQRPTENPTESPVIIPPEPPTESPVIIPPEPPTESPVDIQPPTNSPVAILSESPTKSPVFIQSQKPTKSPVIIQPPTGSPTVASMSYAASFSLVYHSKAAKGKAHKTGKSKDGKLIRQRRV